MNTNNQTIVIDTIIHAPVETVWNYWTQEEHITQWSHASDDWYSPSSSNDLRVGGAFVTRMEAKDSSFGFDFGGTYTVVNLYEMISYTLDDKRKVVTEFVSNGNETRIIQTFDPESTNPLDQQSQGWQSILDNFKRYVEHIHPFL